MDLVEKYNLILKGQEDKTVEIVNRALDRSFNRLLRRLRVWLRTENYSKAERDLAILNILQQLVGPVTPARTDAYDKAFHQIIQAASTAGIDVSDALVGQMAGNRPRIDVSIPLEATLAAAKQSHGYLRKHGQRFAETSAEVIASGVAEGRSQDKMVRELRDRLGVVKSRAEVIVRTESLRAYNEATNEYYAQNGVDYVLYYATADDRSCPICAPRGGKIYKRTTIKVPLHPRCRCYLAPWEPDIASMDPAYQAAGKRHQKEMEAVNTIEPANLNRAAVFEQFAPVPVSVN